MSEKKHGNLELWGKVEKTDPKFTKKVTFGRKYTAIDAQYQIMNATEQFGTYGKWGLKDITHEKIFIADEILLEIKCKFFYPDGEFEMNNCSMLLAKDKNGNLRIDTDAYKKLETDTLTKALSKLGFNADIFLGMYEDQNYVNEVGAEFTQINNEQRVILSKLITETNTDIKVFNEHFNIDTVAEMAQSDYQKALAMLNSKKNKKDK
jgi:hypothetical protein